MTAPSLGIDSIWSVLFMLSDFLYAYMNWKYGERMGWSKLFTLGATVTIWNDVFYHLTFESLPVLLTGNAFLFVLMYTQIRSIFRHLPLIVALLILLVSMAGIIGSPMVFGTGPLTNPLTNPARGDVGFVIIHAIQHAVTAMFQFLQIYLELRAQKKKGKKAKK
jgi:hypothetical protein